MSCSRSRRIATHLLRLLCLCYVCCASILRADNAISAFDSGGNLATNGNLVVESSLGMIGGPADFGDPIDNASSGYTAQIRDAIAFTVAASPAEIAPGETSQLHGTARLDDGSMLLLSGNDIIWDPAPFPVLSTEPNGFLTAASMNEFAPPVSITGHFLGLSASTKLSVNLQTMIWSNGGSFDVIVTNAAGSAGTGWSLLELPKNLDIQSSPDSAFVIRLVSVDSTGASGATPNFNNQTRTVWTFAQAGDGILNFDLAHVQLDTSAFNNYLAGGVFSLEISPDSKTLSIVFTPHACVWSDTTSSCEVFSDGSTRMTFENPYGLRFAAITNLEGCAASAIVYGQGFESGLSLNNFGPDLVQLPESATKITFFPVRTDWSSAGTIRPLVTDMCGNEHLFGIGMSTYTVTEGLGTRHFYHRLPATASRVFVANLSFATCDVKVVVNGTRFDILGVTMWMPGGLDISEALTQNEENEVVVQINGDIGANGTVFIGSEVPTMFAQLWSYSLNTRDEVQPVYPGMSHGRGFGISVVGELLEVSWPTDPSGYELQFYTPETGWQSWVEPVEDIEDRWVARLAPTEKLMFFRLHWIGNDPGGVFGQ